MQHKRVNKETIINIIILVVFVCLVLLTGLHHEPWADEAQAWLIARDCTFKDMIINVLKYEGHPILWFAVLRSLILLHYPYEGLFFIPLISSSIGVGLFLFKSKFPQVIKILFPFTYFVLYQNSVIARNHSLVFPLLALIAVLYEKRLKHPWFYALLLILLASVSAYSFVLAFIMLCFFTADIVKSGKITFKKIIPVLTMLLALCVTALYLIKPADCSANAGLNLFRLNPFRILYILTRGYFNTAPKGFVLYGQMLFTLILYIFAGRTFCKNKAQWTCFVQLIYLLR